MTPRIEKYQGHESYLSILYCIVGCLHSQPIHRNVPLCINLTPAHGVNETPCNSDTSVEESFQNSTLVCNKPQGRIRSKSNLLLLNSSHQTTNLISHNLIPAGITKTLLGSCVCSIASVAKYVEVFITQNVLLPRIFEHFAIFQK
jgi:hypothetical protein